jgi:hypothetical protein
MRNKLRFLGFVTLSAATFAIALHPPPTLDLLSARPRPESLVAAIEELDTAMLKDWRSRRLEPTSRSPELKMMRRWSLALRGNIPSLEELVNFEASPSATRLDGYLDRLLADPRCADNLATRWVLATVGVEDGPFLVYRRRRYHAWIREQLREGLRFDELVRALISAEGLWTDSPATNFITASIDPSTGQPDPIRLTGRLTRGFLGLRLDCAQCHDHPFEDWTQQDFASLSAWFEDTKVGVRGIKDAPTPSPRRAASKELGVQREALPARVPFAAELLPSKGRPRVRLAAWLTHPQNPAFASAVVNRTWAMLFGRALVEPVDDMPLNRRAPRALAILTKDFRDHGFDLRRLIKLIALSRAFSLESKAPDGVSEERDQAWAAFPVTALRPEQVVASLIQSSSIHSLDAQSWWGFRLAELGQTKDFVERYGDPTEDRFDAAPGTIPQRLLLMNGEISRERSKADLVHALGRVIAFGGELSKTLDALWLITLTRRPSPGEREHFLGRLEPLSKDQQRGALEDVFWSLVNSTEFSWNH